MYTEMQNLLSQKWRIAAALALNIVKFTVVYSIPLLALRALGCVELSFIHSLALGSLVWLIAGVLPSVSGLGPTDLAFALLYRRVRRGEHRQRGAGAVQGGDVFHALCRQPADGAYRAAARRACARGEGRKQNGITEQEKERNERVYQTAWVIFIYSFLGWCAEVVFAACRRGIFVNRGFLNGPVCPIYGFGVALVLWLLEPVKDSFLLLFLGSMVLTSALEFIIGFIMESFSTTNGGITQQPLQHQGLYLP